MPDRTLTRDKEGHSTMGPIEVLVVTYPDAGLVAGAAPLLRDLVEAGHVRVADAVVVTHGPDARMLVTDPDDDLIPEWSTISVNPQPLLSAEDLELVSEEIGPDGAAIIIVVEHVWAQALAALATASGGDLALHARVDAETVDAAAKVGA